MSQWRKESLETISEKEHEGRTATGQPEHNNGTNGFAQGNRIKLLVLFIAWTAFTSVSVHTAKLYLSNNGSVAILTATTHLIGALPCIAPVFSCEEWTVSRRFLRDVGFAAVFNLCNTLLTNYSLLQSSVQIVYAIKGLEPTFTTILSLLVANQYPSAAEILAMSGLAITMGLTIRSDPEVPTMIYVASILAVAVVSMRSVLLKHAMSQHRQSVLQIFTAVNAISGVLSLFFIKSEDIYDLTVTASTRTYILLLASSVASLAYYLVSLLFLSYVRPDTHSLFNVFKRLLVALPGSSITSHLLPTSMHSICILGLNAGTLCWAMVSNKTGRNSAKKATRIPVITTACIGAAVLVVTSVIINTGIEQVTQRPASTRHSDTPWLKYRTREVVQARQEVDEHLRKADITVLRAHRLADTGNIGDLYSSPFHYFDQLNNTGHLVIKDIENPSLRRQAQRSDIVIMGGGGLLQVLPEWEKTITNILTDAQPSSAQPGRQVIAWGVGFNGGRDLAESHVRGAFYPSTPYLSKFSLLGLRDKVPGYRWVPCVSNMFEAFDYVYPAKRAIGWFQHSGSTYSLDEHAGLGPDDVRSNAAMDFAETVAFLGSSEVVLTTSYHGLYWATLLGRKVVVLEAKSRKFDLFPWPPVFFSGDLNRDIARAKSYPNALQESRAATLEFWGDVKKLLKEAAGVIEDS